MAERIQLRRTKGWRKPDNTIVVARPSKWGNPFRVQPTLSDDGAPMWGVFRPGWSGPIERWNFKDLAVEAAVTYHRNFVYENCVQLGHHIRTELGGRNLACWCPLDQPCHADVLLAIANEAVNP